MKPAYRIALAAVILLVLASGAGPARADETVYRLLEAADAAQKSGDQGRRLQLLGEAASRARSLAPPNAEAVVAALWQWGLALQDSGDAPAAEARYGEVLAALLRQSGKETDATMEVRERLAAVLVTQGKLPAAEAEMRRVLAYFEANRGRQHEETLRAVDDLAHVLFWAHRYRDAEPLIRRALEGAEARHGPQAVETADALHTLGVTLDQLTRRAEAEVLLRRALAIYDKVRGRRHRVTANTLDSLGRVVMQQGRTAEGEALLREAVDILDAVLPPQDPARVRLLMRQRGLADEEGRYQDAVRFTERALELQRRLRGPRHPDVAETLQTLAAQYELVDRMDDAFRIYDEALEIAVATLGADSALTADIRFFRATALDSVGRRAEAEAAFREALPVYERLYGKGHPYTVGPLAMIGLIQAAQDRNAEAVVTYRAAVRDFQPEVDLDTWKNIHWGLGRALEKTGAPREALDAYRVAAEAIDLLYANTRGLDDARRNRVLEQNGDIYRAYLRLLLQMEENEPGARHGEAALATLSLDQSRLFSEMLRLSAVRRYENDPGFAALRDARGAILGRIEALRGQGAATPAAQQAALAARIRAEQAELAQAEAALRRRYPQFMELLRPLPVEVSELQRSLLGPDEALVALAVLPDRIALFGITRERFLIRQVKVGASEVEARVKAVRRALELKRGLTAAGALDPRVLHRLYLDVFAPVEAIARDKKRVLVVADGPLYALPFELMVTSFDEREAAAFGAARERPAPDAPRLAEYARLAYLGDRHEFAYLPSLAALRALRTQPAPRRERAFSLVAFADPDFGAAPGAPAEALARVRSAGAVGGEALPRLPETAEEAQAVAKAVGGASVLRLGREAQEHRVKSGELAGARYVLFGTHGLLGGESLELAGQREATTSRARSAAGAGMKAQPALVMSLAGDLRNEDGFLTMDEITGSVELTADLVVLSACNTAGEPERRVSGEGFAGLTRAFQYAGARHLVVSHWEVETTSSRDTVVELFRRVEAGASPSAALAASRAAVRATPLKLPDGTAVSRHHPAFWAPFVVVGD